MTISLPTTSKIVIRAKLKPMARAVAQYVFAALLALLAQTAVPSRHVTSPAQIVWCAQAEQRTAEQVRPARFVCREQSIVEYTSCITAPPDTAALFQRPPPATSLFV